MNTIKRRFNAATAAGDAAALEALRREVISRVVAPEPIKPAADSAQTDPKFAGLLGALDDDADDATVLAKLLGEKHVVEAADAIAQEPVQAAVDAVRIGQYRVDALARKYDRELAAVADKLSPDDNMNKHTRRELDERYDELLSDRRIEIGKHRDATVAAVIVERNKVVAERDALEASLADGSEDPLVLVDARETAAASVETRLAAIKKQQQTAAFLSPTPVDPLDELTGTPAEQQRRLATLWAEEPCAKYTGTDWMCFANETPQTQWIVPHIVQVGAATILVGEGGVGKSRLALQLATAASLRDGLWTEDWIPAINGVDSVAVKRSNRPRVTMIVNAEDEQSDAARRIVQIREGVAAACGDKPPIKDMGTELAQGLERLMYYQARGAIWGPVGGSTHIETTAELTEVGKDVRAQCERMGVKLLILDPLANLYASSENTRSHVAAYMRSWNAWAQRTGIAVVMLAHPNKSGDGFSGSTSWVGASRAAIEFRRLEACIGDDGRLQDAKEARAAHKRKQQKDATPGTTKDEPNLATAWLYQLAVSKINHAYRETVWLAESGLAFITGPHKDLFDMARRSKSGGATTTSNGGNQAPAVRGFMK